MLNRWIIRWHPIFVASQNRMLSSSNNICENFSFSHALSITLCYPSLSHCHYISRNPHPPVHRPSPKSILLWFIIILISWKITVLWRWKHYFSPYILRLQSIWSLHFSSSKFSPGYFQFAVNLVPTINSLTKNAYVANNLPCWRTCG